MALQWLREKMRYLTWVLWIVVAAFIVAIFFDFGGFVDPGGPGAGTVAAWVGDEEISYDEFRRAYENLESRYRQAFGGNFNRDMARQFNLPVQAMDSLIDRRILLKEARSLGLKITDAELSAEILKLPIFQDENGEFLGRDQYRQMVTRAMRMSVSEFEDAFREDMLVNRLQQVIAGTTYVSDQEVERAYRAGAERAELRYVQLPAAEFAGKVEASSEELESYFVDHQADYEVPEQRKVSYLLVDTVKLRQSVEIPEEELQAYYNDHPDDYTREAQVRARHILLKTSEERSEDQAREQLAAARSRIEGGEDFATVAQELSEDEVSASRGGDLGLFDRARMVKPFSDAAFDAEVGELVGPVQTSFGLHLIEVQEKRDGGLQPFDEVQNAIRSRLVGEQVQELAESRSQALAARIRTDGIADLAGLQELAAAEDLEVVTSQPFGEADIVPGIGRAEDFNGAAFELAQGGLSDPVKVPRGWAILHLDEVLPSRIPELPEVETRVRAAVEAEMQKDAARDRLEQTRRQLAGGATLEDLASELGLEIQESGSLARRDSIPGLGPSPELMEQALEGDTGDVVGPFSTLQGSVLAEITGRTRFDPEAFATEQDSTRQAQESERVQRMLDSLVELRRRDLEPRYSNQILENFGINPQAG